MRLTPRANFDASPRCAAAADAPPSPSGKCQRGGDRPAARIGVDGEFVADNGTIEAGNRGDQRGRGSWLKRPPLGTVTTFIPPLEISP
uniref:Uncharacterized protein n=1 Tax=Schlesneria paludicola TaxID=360056 RepID=A0A7C4QIL7_9PLAN